MGEDPHTRGGLVDVDLLLGRQDHPDTFDPSAKVLSDLVHEGIHSVRGADDFHRQIRHHFPGLSAWHTLLPRPAVIRHKGHVRAALALEYGAEIKQHLLHSMAQLVLSRKASEIFCERRGQPYVIRTHRG